MFFRKLQLCAILGAVFSVLAIISTLHDGKGLGEALGMIPGAMFVALIVGFWLTRNMDEEGNEVEQSTNDQIYKLQKKLRGTLETAANAAARGDHATAAHMRSHAAVIESELRRLGA